MAFLDLAEALEELGYGTVPERGEFAPWNGFRLVRPVEPSTPARRAYKRAHEAKRRLAVRIAKAPAKAAAREALRLRRARASKARRDRKREEMMMETTPRYMGFINALARCGLVTQAKVICVGREIYDAEHRGDLRQLFSGHRPHHRAARTDFFVWLRHPDRAWSIGQIAVLFDVQPAHVTAALKKRSMYAGEDLDER